MNKTAELRPIVDPDGEFVWIPVEIAPDQEAAVVYARDYWPDKPCYDLWPQERMIVQSYDETDDDGRETLDEYGGDGVAMPCGQDEGRAYWPVRCYKDSGISDA